MLVLDYKMPDQNGFDLARAIRLKFGGDCPPMILFTSISPVESHFREGLEEIGFDAVLTKPAKSSQLLNALLKAIGPEVAATTSRDAAGDRATPGVDDMSVLLVDDNMINQKVGTKILNRLGLDPDVVSGGEEAIESCKTRDYDVVLMVIEMPDMDGIEATAKIREALPPERLPYIVALTANAMLSERDSYLEAGLDDYLRKPIDVDALIECLRAATKTERRPSHRVAT